MCPPVPGSGSTWTRHSFAEVRPTSASSRAGNGGMDSIGLAIVGSGDMGGVYAEAVARHVSGARLVAIHGGRRARALAAEYGVEHEDTLDRVLERRDVDGV